MNENQKSLISDWRKAIRTAQIAHYEYATRAERINSILGILVVILSTTVGTSVFASLAENPEIWIKILVGTMSVFAAILSSIQTFLKYAERAEFHRISAVKYGSLQKEIEQKASFSSLDENETDKWISTFREKWDALAQESPTSRKNIWDSIRAKIKKESSLV